MGRKVYRLDPFSVCGPGAGCVEHSRPHPAVAGLRGRDTPAGGGNGHPPPEGERDPHWGDQAANVITALLTLVVMQLPTADRNLSSLRRPGRRPGYAEGRAGHPAQKGESSPGWAASWLSWRTRSGPGCFRRCIGTRRSWTAQPLWPLPIVARSICANCSRAMSRFISILPPSQLEAQSRWLRLVIASLIRLIGREGMRKGNECLMLLDEAGQLGHMRPLEQGLTLLRAYGLKMAFFFQSRGTTQGRVPRQGGGAARQHRAGVFRYAIVRNGRTSQQDAGRRHDHRGIGQRRRHGELAKRAAAGVEAMAGSTAAIRPELVGDFQGIATPDEVLQLDPRYVVIFLRGIRPLLCRRVIWYADRLFRRLGAGRLVVGGTGQQQQR